MPAKKKRAKVTPKKEQPKAQQTDIEESSTANDKKSYAPLFIGLFVILLGFALIFGLDYLRHTQEPTDNIREYNGFIFEKHDNIWLANIDIRSYDGILSYQILFHYTPDEVEHIPTIRDIKNTPIAPYMMMNKDRIYITTEPDYPAEVILSGVEIAKIAAQIYGKEVKGALTHGDSSIYPIITCRNVNLSQSVVYLRLGNSTGIYDERGCVVVQGTNETELLKAAERLSFELLRIL
jgi:hypothetical protein